MGSVKCATAPQDTNAGGGIMDDLDPVRGADHADRFPGPVRVQQHVHSGGMSALLCISVL